MNKDKQKQEVEQERLRLLADRDIDYDGKLCEKFGQGTVGGHEAIDRCAMIQEMFTEYVGQHPTVLMNAKLYEAADKISFAMYRLYCDIHEAVYNEPSLFEEMK